jgi:hypothetical protein
MNSQATSPPISETVQSLVREKNAAWNRSLANVLSPASCLSITVALDVSGNGLNGPIPTELGNIVSLSKCLIPLLSH